MSAPSARCRFQSDQLRLGRRSYIGVWVVNIRAKYLVGVFGACFLGVAVMTVSVSFAPENSALQWAPLIAWAAFIVFVLLWARRFRGKLPKPTKKQLSWAARSSKRAGWIYIVSPVIAFLAFGDQLIRMPYGLGFLLPIFPLALGVHNLRFSARLSRQQAADEEPVLPQSE